MVLVRLPDNWMPIKLSGSKDHASGSGAFFAETADVAKQAPSRKIATFDFIGSIP
jgi:hypothetical protein